LVLHRRVTHEQMDGRLTIRCDHEIRLRATANPCSAWLNPRTAINQVDDSRAVPRGASRLPSLHLASWLKRERADRHVANTPACGRIDLELQTRDRQRNCKPPGPA